MKKEETHRLQGARIFFKDEAMAWAPPRNESDWLDGKMRGGWSQREKRRCQRSLSCRMRSKAAKWTLMAKATTSRQKQSFVEEKERYQAKRVRR